MHEYTVALRISGPTLDTARITRELGMAPTLTRQVGERRDSKTVWEKAMWALDVYPDDGGNQWQSLEDGLAALFRVLSGHAKELHEYARLYEMCLWCGHFSSSFCGGPELSPGILKALGEFGVPLYLDTYLSD
jgi:hypothetical protein